MYLWIGHKRRGLGVVVVVWLTNRGQKVGFSPSRDLLVICISLLLLREMIYLQIIPRVECKQRSECIQYQWPTPIRQQQRPRHKSSRNQLISSILYSLSACSLNLKQNFSEPRYVDGNTTVVVRQSAKVKLNEINHVCRLLSYAITPSLLKLFIVFLHGCHVALGGMYLPLVLLPIQHNYQSSSGASSSAPPFWNYYYSVLLTSGTLAWRDPSPGRRDCTP